MRSLAVAGGLGGSELVGRFLSGWEVWRTGRLLDLGGVWHGRGLRVDFPVAVPGWGCVRSGVVLSAGEVGLLSGRFFLDHPDDFAFRVGFWDSGVVEADSGSVTRFHGFSKGVGAVPCDVVGFSSGGVLGLLPDQVWGDFGVDLGVGGGGPRVWAYGYEFFPSGVNLSGSSIRGGLFLRATPMSLLGIELSVATAVRGM